MGERRTPVNMPFVKRSVDLYILMQRAETDAEFLMLQNEYEKLSSENGHSVSHCETLKEFRQGPSPKSLTTSHCSESPPTSHFHLSKAEISNLESIAWYLGRMQERMSELKFPNSDRYMQAAGEAENALIRLVSIVQSRI